MQMKLTKLMFANVVVFAICCCLCSCSRSTDSASSSAKGNATSNSSKPPIAIVVSEEQMKVIKALPSDLACFTPAKNPVQSLQGLSDGQFASYVTSPYIPQKLMSAFGREDTVVGLRVIGTSGFSFDKQPALRLFITHEAYANDIIKGGGVRIQFRTQ